MKIKPFFIFIFIIASMMLAGSAGFVLADELSELDDLGASSNVGGSCPGLVPCGCSSGPPCNICHIFTLIQRVLNFLWWYISIPLATLMLAYAGFLLMIPSLGSGSPPMITKGKKVLKNTVVGIMIVFFSWLFIDTIIKVIAGQELGSGKAAEIFGPWNEVRCAAKAAVSTQLPGNKLLEDLFSKNTGQSKITEKERSRIIEDVLLHRSTPTSAEIQKQTIDLLTKYPGSFSASADCGGNNHADGTMRAVASGGFPPVCSPTCDCKAGGTNGTVNLDSRILALTDRILRAYQGRVVVGSLTTGRHGADSKHYLGKAVDFKVTDSKLRYAEVEFVIRNAVGGDSFHQCESRGTRVDCRNSDSIDHIHVQYNK